MVLGWLVLGWLITTVNCGKTAERIEMKLGTKVGLDKSHIVLGGGPGPPREGGNGNFHHCEWSNVDVAVC